MRTCGAGPKENDSPWFAFLITVIWFSNASITARSATCCGSSWALIDLVNHRDVGFKMFGETAEKELPERTVVWSLSSNRFVQPYQVDDVELIEPVTNPVADSCMVCYE